MKLVKKYVLEIQTTFSLNIPQGADMLCLKTEAGPGFVEVPVLRTLEDPEVTTEEVDFLLVQDEDLRQDLQNAVYVDSVIIGQEEYHLFRV